MSIVSEVKEFAMKGSLIDTAVELSTGLICKSNIKTLTADFYAVGTDQFALLNKKCGCLSLKHFSLAIVCCVLSLQLVACGSNGDGTGPETGSIQLLQATGDVKRVGFFSVSMAAEGFVEFDVLFSKFETAVPASLFNTQRVLGFTDTCEVRLDNVVSASANNSQSLPAISRISAGDTIIISSPAGTFATLVKYDDDEDFSYSTGEGESDTFPAPVPAGLTIDIPGDEFPSFANVPVPDALPSLELLAPTLESPITPETQFSWVPATGSVGKLEIYVLDAERQRTAVFCTVADDGFFSFPTSIQDDLGENFSGWLETVQREAIYTQQKGDAFLYIENSTGF